MKSWALGLLLLTAMGATAQENWNFDPAAGQIVAFHIRPGTGEGPWNTLQNPIVVHIGDILRLYNDDSIDHWLHTGGSPCPHGTDSFGPGETYDCVISSKHNASAMDLYDHNIGPGSWVFIQAD